jgi:hypothetical protein
MDKIIFKDFQTKICSGWLNVVSDTIWEALGQAKTPQEARQFIGAVEEAPNDGKPYLRASLGWYEASGLLIHNDIGGRGASDAHPMSAITGLDSALAGKQPSLPSQAGQAGQFLTTDGSNLDWQEVDALPDQSGHAGEFLTTNGTSPSWVPAQANLTGFGLFEHAHTIIEDYTMASGNNAISGGPIVVENGASVTVPDGSTWTIC